MQMCSRIEVKLKELPPGPHSRRSLLAQTSPFKRASEISRNDEFFLRTTPEKDEGAIARDSWYVVATER